MTNVIPVSPEVQELFQLYLATSPRTRTFDEALSFVCEMGLGDLIALRKACGLLLAQYESSGDMVMGGKLTNEPFLAIRKLLPR